MKCGRENHTHNYMIVDLAVNTIGKLQSLKKPQML